MPRIFIFILLFVLLGTVGCSEATDTFPTTMQKMDIYTPAQSKNPYSVFQIGDQIGIYPVSYKDGVPGTLGDISNPMNACYTYTSWGWEATFDEEIYLDETLMDIYAYTPYDQEMSRTSGKLNLTAYPFDLSGNQANENKDFLWTKVPSVSGQSPTIGLMFEHLMSRIIINLTYLGTSDTANDISLHNIITNCSINLRTGEVTSGNQRETIFPSIQDEPSAGYDQTYIAFLPPQTIASGTPLFLIEYLGETWVYNLDQDVTFNALNSYTFNLNMSQQNYMPSKRQLSVSPTITQR